MPDTEGNTKADEETIAGTPLHAYKEGRKDDVKGDIEELQSSDRPQQKNIEDDDEPSLPKH